MPLRLPQRTRRSTTWPSTVGTAVRDRDPLQREFFQTEKNLKRFVAGPVREENEAQRQAARSRRRSKSKRQPELDRAPTAANSRHGTVRLLAAGKGDQLS
jgi:hypothetical protein